MISLYDHQKLALSKMKNGCILCGGVGSGKSRTALAYYYEKNGGDINSESYAKMSNPKDLIIITTAQKRDKMEWQGDMLPFHITDNKDISEYKNNVVIDSWNNISKYISYEGAFFIFDEQRVVGYGAWSKAFIEITKKNEWILLSATPGDTWMDYIPVFIANGFYKNKTQFEREHVIYRRFSKFPQIDRYVNTNRLMRLKNRILIKMDFNRSTVPHHEHVIVDYDRIRYKTCISERFNYETQEPFKNASELCIALRKIVNSDESRAKIVEQLVKKHEKVIIFYNFDYELDILKNINYGPDVEVAELNGHKHQCVPIGNKWVYLVNYNAGAEGWNCIKTNAMIFYSLNYSYRTMVQASGRIDRLNTMFTDLYYYYLESTSSMDVMIRRALKAKKKFNETNFVSGMNFGG